MRRLSDIQRRLLFSAGILAMLAGIFTAGWWSNRQAGESICQELKVEITNSDSSVFVTRKSILNELAKLNIDPIGKPFSSINTLQIEQTLNQSEYLENVECVIDNNKTLLIRATQLVPVMRVFDGTASYYVNRKGKRMSATAQYHADVPVVSGHFNSQFPPVKLLPLIQYVQADEMLNSLVTMYSMRDSNNVFIIPCILGHVVNVGHPDDFDNKFAKLREFYTKVIPYKGWLYYDTISLKFNHQIVATRRIKAVRNDFDWASQADDVDADIETMMVSDTTHVMGNADEHHSKSVSVKSKESASTQSSSKDKAEVQKSNGKQSQKTENKEISNKMKKAFQ